MDLAELIQTQVKSIEAAARAASGQKRGEADLGRPAALFNARLDRTEARIALLESQRAETDKRFAEAIAQQKALREDLAKEAKIWADRAPTPPKSAPARKPGATKAARRG